MKRPGIGSDFESLESTRRRSGQTPPWELEGAPIAYVESGRQALALLGRALHARGRRRLLVPAYLCDSMVQPFLSDGWQIDALPVTDDLRFDVRSEAGLTRRMDDAVVLLASYFGRQPDSAHVALARRAQERGAVVIEDETHRVFQPGADFADVAFASLRKLLPVGDGAYIRGDADAAAAVEALPASTSSRWSAMDAKRRAMDEEDDSVDYRQAFREANDALEQHDRIHAATPRTREVLGDLPYGSLAATRQSNAAVLRDRLLGSGIEILPWADSEVPSHVVVVAPGAQDLQRRLARHGLYCAIHWPEVSGVSGISSWRHDLLSVPVDHRYSGEDMQSAAESIVKEYAK